MYSTALHPRDANMARLTTRLAQHDRPAFATVHEWIHEAPAAANDEILTIIMIIEMMLMMTVTVVVDDD